LCTREVDAEFTHDRDDVGVDLAGRRRASGADVDAIRSE
jgi:hypothetical protein